MTAVLVNYWIIFMFGEVLCDKESGGAGTPRRAVLRLSPSLQPQDKHRRYDLMVNYS